MSARVEVVRNHARAERNIAWIEKLKITVGEKIGQPFRLTEFQKDFIRDIYEPEDAAKPGKLLTTLATLSVGRKNGKSEIAGALVLLHLIGPESETNGQIVSGATTHKQARIVFETVVRFLNATGTAKEGTGLYKYLRVVDSTSTIYVKVSGIRAQGSKYMAIAAGPGAAQGLNPSLIIMDELAQASNRSFFDAMKESQGARPQPFMMVISTQAADPQHVLSTTIDDGLRRVEGAICDRPANRSCPRCGVDQRATVHLYAATPGCDLLDSAEWYASNPALGLWIDYDRFAANAATAHRNPAEEASFRLYRLNQRVSPHAPLFSSYDWNECLMASAKSKPPANRVQTDFEFEKGEKLFGGLDMSARIDLSALVMVSAEDAARTKAWFWKPSSELVRHGDRDGQQYARYAEQGWMIGTPGKTIRPGFVVRKIMELNERFDILGIAYDRDPKHMRELLNIMEDEGLYAVEGDGDGFVDALRLVPWGQGFTSMAVAVNALEAAVLPGPDGKRAFQHDGNPLLTWNMANAMVDRDFKDNRKLVKMTDKFRIDGAVALAMAMGLRELDRPKQAIRNPYEDPNYDPYRHM